MEKDRKYLAYIEMRMRDAKKGANEVADLIQLDMYSLAQPGTVPDVKVVEVTKITNE